MGWRDWGRRHLGATPRTGDEAARDVLPVEDTMAVLGRPPGDFNSAILRHVHDEMMRAAAELPNLSNSVVNSSLLRDILPDFVVALLSKPVTESRPPSGAATHAWRDGGDVKVTTWLRASPTLTECVRAEPQVLRLRIYNGPEGQWSPTRLEFGTVHDQVQLSALDVLPGERVLMGTVTYSRAAQALPTFGGG